MSEATIPIVDLSDFTTGDNRKQQFVEQLGEAYENVGFVGVKNHGIPADLVDRFYERVEQFFHLPENIKNKYEIDGLAGQRGYTSFGKEHAKGSDTPDLKEFWQIGQELDNMEEAPADYPPNVEVKELPDFHQLGTALYRSFESAGRELLKAIALFLELNENYFDELIENGNSILRAIHYPPIKEAPKSAIRAEQHEDINLITLLVGASAEGLQLLTRNDKWVGVTAPPGHIVVNVGDMLQRLTNGRLRSTTHRVVNPPKEKWHTDRYSIPFFLHPKSGMPLNCLESCVDDAHPKQYADITAGAYLDERLREIGLKK